MEFLPGERWNRRCGAHTRSTHRLMWLSPGSTDTARLIERSLAARNGSIATLIAETGGLHRDDRRQARRLPSRLCSTRLLSGFNGAGQRCSALRVLLLQRGIAPRVLELLAGYMEELRIGDPALLATDVGPVIDRGGGGGAPDARRSRRPDHRRRALVSPGQAARVAAFRPLLAPLAVEVASLANPLNGRCLGPSCTWCATRLRSWIRSSTP